MTTVRPASSSPAAAGPRYGRPFAVLGAGGRRLADIIARPGQPVAAGHVPSQGAGN